MTRSTLPRLLLFAATLTLVACGASPTAPTAPTGTIPIATTLRPVVLNGSIYLLDPLTSTVASTPSGTLRVEVQSTNLPTGVAVSLRITRPSGVVEVSGIGMGSVLPMNSALTFIHPGDGPGCSLPGMPPAPGTPIRDGSMTLVINSAPPDPAWGGMLGITTCPLNSATSMLAYDVRLTPQ